MKTRLWVACSTLVSMYRTMSLSQTSSRMTTRQPCLKIWPSLLGRRTRSHWLTCPRCTVPWTIPRLQFDHILRQALNVDTLPEDLPNAAELVHDHFVICAKSSRPVPRPRVALPSVHQTKVCASVDYGDIHHPSHGKAFRVLIMAEDFSGRVYASIVDDSSVTGERTAEAFMMLSCETFAKFTIDPDTRFDNKFFRTLLGKMGTEVRTVPTDAHWASHAEKPVHLL
jgi:hypothetical protein